MTKQRHITVRAPVELVAQFVKVCKERDTSASKEIRRFMRETIKGATNVK